MQLQWLGLLAPALLLAGCDFTRDDRDKAAPTPQATVAATQIDGDYLKTGGDGTNWAAAGFNYYEQRYSPLSQIDRSNVGRLGIAWTADLPDGEIPQSTPIAVDGKIYLTTPRSRVFAFDAASGEQLWSFGSGLDQPDGTAASANAVGKGNQGIAIWKGRLFLGTLDGQLIALDAITGAQLWAVKTGGDGADNVLTAPPRVVKNMVIVGSGDSARGARGYVSAYDVSDGTLRWRFYTVPKGEGPPDKASSDAVLQTAVQTWGGAVLGAAAGGRVTDAITYDPDLDRLYIGVGPGTPTAPAAAPALGLAPAGKAGDRLFLSSVVALDPDNGEYLWHYQETPGGQPAFGADQPFVLAELPVSRPQPKARAATQAAPKARPDPNDPDAAPTGQPAAVAMRKVLLHASDNGFFFVIDRVDGTLISATALYDGARWTQGFDPLTGRPVPAQTSAPVSASAKAAKPAAAAAQPPRAIFPPVRPDRPARWMSFNPQTGLVYFQLPRFTEVRASQPTAAPANGPRPAAPLPPRMAIGGARIVAFDPVAGAVRWSRDLTAGRNGAPLSTAGGLLFFGTGIGRFVALDAQTGATLFNRDLGSGIAAPPSTLRVGGAQYVAVLTGMGGGFAVAADMAENDGAAPRASSAKDRVSAKDRISAKDRAGKSAPSSGLLLRVPARPRLLLLRLGASGALPGGPVPTPRPSPTPLLPESGPGTGPGTGTGTEMGPGRG